MRARTFLTVAALVFSAGCTNFNPGLYIEGSVVATVDGTTCTWAVDGALLPQGFYNVDFPAAYQVFPVYNNQLRARTAALSSDPNGIQVRGVEVKIMDAGRNPVAFSGLPNPFSLPTSTFVAASADGTTPGRAVGAVTIIPESYRQQLTALAEGTLLVVQVIPFGRTNGGSELDGTEWQWVTELCHGTCLFSCPGADDTVGGCTPGQDQTVFHPCGCGINSTGCDIGSI